MTEFYVSGAGKSGWNIPDISHKKSMMAAKYQDHYFRVLVTGVATQEVVTGLFIDYGTSSEIPITELRWLRKVFLSLPAQALSVRLWGIKEEEGHEHEARKSLKKLTEDGNVDGFAVTVVRVPTNLTRRLYN